VADRLINIHPSLLPSFKGLDSPPSGWRRACAFPVHRPFRPPGMDAGPIILKRRAGA